MVRSPPPTHNCSVFIYFLLNLHCLVFCLLRHYFPHFFDLSWKKMIVFMLSWLCNVWNVLHLSKVFEFPSSESSITCVTSVNPAVDSSLQWQLLVCPQEGCWGHSFSDHLPLIFLSWISAGHLLLRELLWMFLFHSPAPESLPGTLPFCLSPPYC